MAEKSEIFEQIPSLVGRNILNLRKIQNKTQMQLADLAEIPRSTLANIEAGIGNPSLQNILRIVNALQVSLEEILSEPSPQCRLYHAHEIKTEKRSDGKCMIHKLLPDPLPGMEIDRMELKPQSRMRGVPHLKDTKEYFSCVSGEFQIFVDGQSYTVAKNEVLAFPGDRAHSYFNSGSQLAIGFSVVVLAI